MRRGFLVPLAEDLRRAVDKLASRNFDLGKEARGGGLYLPGNQHARSEVVVVRRPLREVLTNVQRFARDRLRRWQKRDESLQAAGPSIMVLYEHSFTQTCPLYPATFRARWNLNNERERTRRSAQNQRVPYEIELRLQIDQRSPDTVSIDVCIAETIDPMGAMVDYPIGHHYLAPSAIHGQPWFDELIAYLSAYA